MAGTRSRPFSNGLRVALLSVIALLTGCASIGPGKIHRDHFDYANELRSSAQEQLLLNALALRYGEAPMFLEVSSVISTYAVEGSVNAGAAWGTGLIGGDSQNLGAAGRYREQPTVTYTPLSGDRFTRSLLSPIPPVSLFSLTQSGWPVKLIFGLAVRSINNVSAPSRLRILGGEGDSDYAALLDAMQRVQFSKKLDIRIERRAGDAVAVMFFSEAVSPETAQDLTFIRNALGLDSGVQEFALTFGRVPQGGAEIAVLSKSMIEILGEIGASVDVPAEHLGEGRVRYSVAQDDRTLLPLTIASGTDEPDNAMVKVRFRDHWFWISDRDYESKQIFMFAGLLLSLAETGAVRTAPVVTVPAG
jgi:hypothetical protein